MKSYLTRDFISCFRKLPERIKRLAGKNYRIWKQNPSHPALQFKLVGRRRPVYSIRVGLGWRALGLKSDDTIIWFWIGSHADYSGLVSRL